MAIESPPPVNPELHTIPIERPELKDPWWERMAFPLVLGVAIVCALAVFWHTQNLRHDLALERIQFDREQMREAQQTERLRIEKAKTLDALQSPVSSIALGAAGFALLRELIAKGAPPTGSGTAQSDKRSTATISGMVDALVSAGQIATSEAKSLKDDLQKAGVEIGVDAAKALIDRYIKVHDKPPAGGEKAGQASHGTTQVNMYCNAQPVRIAQPPTPPSVPMRSCP